MLGQATFLDQHSEDSWANFVRDMNDWYKKMRVIPVDSGMMFPNKVDLLAEGKRANMTREEHEAYIDAIYQERSKGNRKIRRREGEGYSNRYAKDGKPIHFLSVTEGGEKSYESGYQAPHIHEYFHYLDKIMNKQMGDLTGGAGIAARMASYGSNLSEEELLKRWMDDPETAHLDFENPNDPRAGIVTGGRNNPRKKMGEFLAAMLNDEQFENWMATSHSDYFTQPSEMLSYAAQPIVKETDLNRQVQEYNWMFGTDWEKEGLDRDLSNAISSYLNKMQWDKEHPNLVGTEFDVFMIP